MRIRHLYISPGHNFFGHHGQAAGNHPAIEVSEVHCVASRGIQGDRFFDYKQNYKGQITFFAIEVYEEVCHVLGVHGKDAAVLRRNVITESADLNAFVGAEFDVQGVHFRGVEECSPCYWMNAALAPGAEALMKGRGGLRALILTDGCLRAESK
ncbi:MAG: MOSC domain-containing protein [Limisphaerales bacterium]